MSDSGTQSPEPIKGRDESGTIIYNQKRKLEKLLKQAQRAHEWRVQVWAQSEQRIAQINAQLAVLGAEPYVCFDPNFNDPEMLAHYAGMSITK